MVGRFLRAAALALMMHSAWAADAVGAKDPLEYPLKQYAFILALSLLGGLVGWYSKVRRGHLHVANLMALVGELATSALAGLLVFYLCEYLNVAPVLTAAVVGMAGHTGAKVLSWAEEALKARADRLAGLAMPPVTTRSAESDEAKP